MALQRGLVSVPFDGGLDTKTDEKLVIPGKLTRLENGLYERGGSLTKRPGSVRVGLNTGGQNRLASFNEELVAVSRRKVVTLAPSASNAWVERGKADTVTSNTRPVIHNRSEQLRAKSTIVFSGDSCVSIHVWEDSRGGIRGSILDEVTGAAILADFSLSATGIRPQACTSSDGAFGLILYTEGNNLQAVRYVAGDSVFDPAATVVTDSAGASSALVAMPDGLFCLAYADTAGDLSLMTFDDGLGVISSLVINDNASAALSLCRAADGDIYVAWYSGVTGLNVQRLTDVLVEVWAAPTVLDSALSAPNNLALCVFAGLGVLVLYDTPDGADSFILRATCKEDGATVARSVWLRSVALASAIRFDSASQTATCAVVHFSAEQSCVFLLRHGLDDVPRVIAKVRPGECGGIPENEGGLPSFAADAALFGQYHLALSTVGRFSVEDSEIVTLKGVDRWLVNFDGAEGTASKQIGAAQLGENLLLCGGVVSLYDGRGITEHGFHLYPEGVVKGAAPENAATTAYLPAKTYQVSAVYEWLDGAGQLHQSAPSTALSVAPPAAPGDGYESVTYTIPTLRLTEKADVRIALYRTQGDGTVMYRLTETSGADFLANVTTSDAVSWVDDMDDADLPGQSILYTTGGVLEDTAPPSASVAAEHAGRVWLGNGDRLFPSKTHVHGEAVRFSDALAVQLPRLGGDVTGLASMDDKLVVFREGAIFIQSGEGPNDAGVGQWFEPVLVTQEVGCPRGVFAPMPNGLLFESAKGIFLLTRTLEIAHVGQPVEATWEGLTLKCAVLDGARNLVRFFSLEGTELVYDYAHRQPDGTVGAWATFTGHIAHHAANHLGVVHWLNGFVSRDDEAATLDHTTGYQMVAETAWLKLAGLAGVQRVRRVGLVGVGEASGFTRGDLSVEIGYDYESDYATPIQIGPDGDAGDAFRIRVHMPRQKCTAVRFRFSDDGLDAGYSLSNLTLEVGLKQGLFKRSTGDTFG